MPEDLSWCHQVILIPFRVFWIVSSFIVISKLAAGQMKCRRGVRNGRFQRT